MTDEVELGSKSASPTSPTLVEKVCRVPQVTMFFWIIKCLSTALGETIADACGVFIASLQGRLGMFIGILVPFMAFQFFLRRYVPAIYWMCVILISITGTLITDLLSDGAGVEKYILIIIFAFLLAVTFSGWYYREHTLSIHTIYTAQREMWYWGVVLWTFALGTAVGDIVSEDGNLGYWRTLLIVVSLCIVDYLILLLSQKFIEPKTWHPILAFWIAYVLTRPLGASVGDLLTGDAGPTFSGDCGNTTAVVCATDDVFCITGQDCPTSGDNTCAFNTSTCYTPLACDNCQGFEAVLVTNVVFSIVVVAIVIYLHISKIDEEKRTVEKGRADEQA
jgi:uncharacterized membrane-anchored protein